MVETAVFKRSTLLRALPERKLRELLRIARVREARAGEIIFSKADLAKHMFIVSSGKVKIYITSGGRKRKTFAYLGPGEFFGEMALLDAKERSASAEAVTDARLMVVQQRDFKRFLLADTKLCYELLRTLSERLRSANEQIENLLFRNVLGRVAKTLRDLSRREGRPVRGGILIEQALTRQELADLVGTTREPLSRALATLRRAQLVRLEEGRLLLCNPKRLETMVQAAAAG